MKLLNKTLTALALVASFSSSAALVTVDEWHETGDDFGGLKQSSFSQDIFFAVGDQNYFDISNSYQMMSGYRIASFEEYEQILSEVVSKSPEKSSYHNKAGWDGYVFNGQYRYAFTFLNYDVGSEFIHAGGVDYNLRYKIASEYQLNNNWAGFVLIKDESSDGGIYSFQGDQLSLVSSVPTPFMLSVFTLAILGVSSRKIKAS